MNIKELINDRKLIKIQIDNDKVTKSLQKAEEFLEKAKTLKLQEHNELVIFSAYTSAFHSARAILYKEGMQEKSHYAIYVYLKEKHAKNLDNLLFEFNSLREQRHTGIYGFDFEFDSEDADHAISVAESFLIRIKQIISHSFIN